MTHIFDIKAIALGLLTAVIVGTAFVVLIAKAKQLFWAGTNLTNLFLYIC